MRFNEKSGGLSNAFAKLFHLSGLFLFIGIKYLSTSKTYSHSISNIANSQTIVGFPRGYLRCKSALLDFLCVMTYALVLLSRVNIFCCSS